MSTMHRLLRASGAAGERRRQATHPARKKPELLATGPGEVWSWDITKLRGPGRGVWFQLYVVLDIFSRYVVAWTVQNGEDSEVAKTMLEEAMGVHGIPQAVHADRGTSMTSKPVAQLLLDLGVDRSHSRPRVSNDCEHCECSTTWGLTPVTTGPAGAFGVDVSTPGGGAHQAAGRVGSDLIGA